MDKKVLNERLNELIRQIKLNSKDAHFAEKLTYDLLHVHREKLQEKTYVFELGQELYKVENGHFYISRHERGILFHIYNSYDIVVPISHSCLYSTLLSVLNERELEYESLSEEDKKDSDTFLEVVGIILAMPLNIFNDTEFAIDIATQVLKRTNELYEKAANAELQDEDLYKDEEFVEMTLDAENIKNTIIDGMESIKDTVNGK